MKRMKVLALLTLVMVLSAGRVFGEAETGKEAAAVAWNVKAISAPAYETATAHDPKFEDTALWPVDVKMADYFKQEWPKARVLTWANPGQGAKDGWEAKYWLEDGKPATTPFDADTDLVFPESAKDFYWVSITAGRKYQPANYRHLTIGKRAGIIGHFSAGGNVWIKAGASVQYLDSMVGGKNTFVRNDNGDMRLVDHFFINKTPTASVEMIGKYSSDDNWRVNSGMLIVGPDSEIYAGSRTDPTVTEKGTLVLLSGGYFTRRSNCDWGIDLILNGKLLAGLPDRPLTRDARLGLGWKSKGKLMGTEGGGRMPGPNDYGMVVAEGGSIAVNTADLSKARLVINCSKQDNDWGQIKIISHGRPLQGEELIAKLKELPRLTDMVIKGKVSWEAIRFEDIRKGGIHVRTMPNLSGKNAPTFGDGNQGKPEELFTVVDQAKAGK